ncbi:hypothetical protein [Enterococcus alishanensis]
MGRPVHRLYNQKFDEHFYMLDASKYENIANAGCEKEWMAFYA